MNADAHRPIRRGFSPPIWFAAGGGWRIHLPSIIGPGCPPVGETYGVLPPIPPPTDRPAQQHADLNLALRGYESTNAYPGMVDYGGPHDSRAPQLRYLFSDRRIPPFVALYRVHDWDWGCNCRGAALQNPEVTFMGMGARAGETVHVPRSGYDIGQGYQVLVLYASENRLTLKYTGEDNVVVGYTLHLENVCVDPALLSLYRQCDASGRRNLPALRATQAVGRAAGNQLGVAIRDCGTFLDPRSEKDWWQSGG